MTERFSTQPGTNPFAPPAPRERIADLKVTRQESGKERQAILDEAKKILNEWFGMEKLPKELLKETLDIRRAITARVAAEGFVDTLDAETLEKIQTLSLRISRYTDMEPGLDRPASEYETALIETFNDYFDAFRLAENARGFRNTLRETKEEVVKEALMGKKNFYTKENLQEFAEKEFPEKILKDRLTEKYAHAGFTPEEIQELVKLCDIEDLNALPIHEIQTIKQTNDLFSRYLKGERGKYLGLSVALLVPSLIRGVAPALLAEAFKGSEVDITHIGLFGLAEISTAAATVGINTYFEKFLKENLAKPGGFNEDLAENFTQFPGGSIREFGMETIRRRSGDALGGYENVLRTVSYNILPTITMLITSITVLGYKNTALAGGTALGAGLMALLDKQMQKRGKFWKKREAVEKQHEEFAHALNEQMSAHLETILSGEKDQLQKRLEKLMQESRVADAQLNVLQTIEQNIYRVFHATNMIVAAIVSYLTQGGSSGFIAALVYSQNFNQGIQTLLETKRRLQTSLRNITEMELMFNGHAKEEKEQEGRRKGMEQINGNDIVLSNITVKYKDRRIFDRASAKIPGGSFCSVRGASGAGKSTLLKIMSGYYTPTSGQAFLGTDEKTGNPVPVKDIKKSGPDSLYRKIAYLSQFPYLFDGTIKDNLTFGVQGDVDEITLLETIEEVGLKSRFSNLQERLAGGRGDQGGTSGGETSRVGLARTLLKIRTEHSRIVFLDEPTASVDADTKKDIARILNEEKKKHPETTFVVISHDTEFLEMLALDQTITSDKGKLITSRIERLPAHES